MSHIALADRWRAQPRIGASVDREAIDRLGICGGFVSSAGGIAMRDLLGAPLLFSHPTSVDLLPTPFPREGVAATFWRDGSTSRQCGFYTGSPHARAFTFQARVRLDAAPGLSGVIARTDTSVAGIGSTIPLWRPSGAFDMRIAGTDYTQAGSWALGRWVDIQIVTTAASARMYVDGSLVISGSAPANANIQPILAFGSVAGGAFGNDELHLMYCLVSNRTLSDAQLQGFRENPWQIFKPRKRVVYFLGGIGRPTLSLPGVTDIGTTSARPRVMLTY